MKLAGWTFWHSGSAAARGRRQPQDKHGLGAVPTAKPHKQSLPHQMAGRMLSLPGMLHLISSVLTCCEQGHSGDSNAIAVHECPYLKAKHTYHKYNSLPCTCMACMLTPLCLSWAVGHACKVHNSLRRSRILHNAQTGIFIYRAKQRSVRGIK